MTPKEYKNKMMVKVMVGKMAGQNLDVLSINYEDGKVYCKDTEKPFYDIWTFNLSDVQIATPVMYEGVNVCVGDKIKYGLKWYEVYDYVWFGGEIRVMASFDIPMTFTEDEIQALDPLYKEVKDEELKTIIIDGQNYKLTKI